METSKFEAFHDGHVVVISEDEVREQSSLGYKLVEIIYIDVATVGYEEVERKNADSYSSSDKITLEKTIVTREPRFVMAKAFGEVIAERDAEIEKLNVALKTASKEMLEALKTLEEKKKDVARMSERIENLTSAIDNETKRCESARSANYKFENDIAKIRTAIGDLRMREILGVDRG